MAKKIYCLAEMGYQFDLETDLRGGGERVWNDMLTLLKNVGYEVFPYQFSYERKRVTFRNHKVNGIGNIPKSGTNNQAYVEGINYFYEEAKDADGIYLLSMNLSQKTAKIPTITVSHGIMFNHCERNTMFTDPVGYLEAFKRWVRNATYTISCDTDTIHQMAVYYPENIKKMTYIPNYVDLNVFRPQEKSDDGIFRILYPRRLQHCRGFTVLMQACDYLLEKYKDIEVIFCGKGNKPEEDYFYKWKATKDDRIKHIWYDPSEMKRAYRNVSVSIVPTLYSEGSSLSLSESIACKVLPIVTYVGGLSDLVQPYVNGLVIPPNNPKALIQAIEYVIQNKEEVDYMRETGQRMIRAFDKKFWDKKITDVVKKIYGEP